MFAIVFGIICICFTVFACLPMGLGWGANIVLFLKGALPVFAALTGLVAILIGVADIRDRNEAKREEMEAVKSE
jgi:hypothetical protein